MPRETHNLTRQDILPLPDWEAVRKDHRKALSERKKRRRLSIGPHATLYFENWDTMWYQVQEMLRIEKGGEEQIADELAAYNPMVPNGSELTGTLMFEIAEEGLRRAILSQLGGVEDKVSMSLGGVRIQATYEAEVERTTADGKTSSIHFLHFPLSQEQVALFKDRAVEAMVRIDHSNYGHAAIIGEAVRAELTADLD